jgi:hypothetical protein
MRQTHEEIVHEAEARRLSTNAALIQEAPGLPPIVH